MNGNLGSVFAQLDDVVLGKPTQLKLAVACLLAKGHLLIEDLPGMGKTTLSHALANVMGLTYQRVQFTSDMLPADLIGVSIFDKNKQAFVFHRGPVFTQLLLADEINRASPKTQSALLEAMAENQVSVDGETYTLDAPFFVVATQNPQDQAGTFPLPESQLDRFLMRIELGFPSHQAEREMLSGKGGYDERDVAAVLRPGDLSALQRQASNLFVSDALLDYILALVNESRVNRNFPNPLSPRASKALLAASKAWAFINGRDHVLPDDVQAVFPSVVEHRLRSGLPLGRSSEPSLSESLLKSVAVSG